MNTVQKPYGNEKFINTTLMEYFLIRTKALLKPQRQTKYQSVQSEVLVMVIV